MSRSTSTIRSGKGDGDVQENPNDDVPMTPEKELYPRRFPRLGSQFQTRISKSTEPTDRPVPLPMSIDFPYLTTQDVIEQKVYLQQQWKHQIVSFKTISEQSAVESLSASEQDRPTKQQKPTDHDDGIVSTTTSSAPPLDRNNQYQAAGQGQTVSTSTATMAEENRINDNDNTTPITSSSSSSAGVTTTTTTTHRRGGTLIYRPAQNMDNYTSFCQPFVSSLSSTGRDMQNTPSDQASWKQHMIQLHGQTESTLAAAGGTNGKRSRSARGGMKRKRSQDEDNDKKNTGGGDNKSNSSKNKDETNDDKNNNNNNNDDGSDLMLWKLEEMLEQQRLDRNNGVASNTNNSSTVSCHDGSSSSPTTIVSGQRRDGIKSDNNSPVANWNIGGEEEATILEHLHATTGDNIAVGQFNALVQFTAGQGIKMRKTREKKWAKNKPRSASLRPTTDTWRELYQKMQFPSLLGQLQDDTNIRFMLHGRTQSGTMNGDQDGQDDAFGAFETDDDMKDTWRSILTCAKSIERQLTGDGRTDRKPFLSTILTFTSNAYHLPRPEESFGTNHVMIEELSTSFITILDHVEKAQEAAAKLRDKIYNSSADGVESEALLKLIDSEFDPLPIRLHEVDMLRSYQKTIKEWEGRVASMLDHDEEEVFNPHSGNTLEAAEMLKDEAKSHGYISKALVQLVARMNKAYDLRSRILEWNASCQGGSRGNIKTLNALVKEAHRVKLIFEEVSVIIETHAKIEGWIERANIALRSRIALSEIKELLHKAKDLSVDLSEYEDKLRSRAASAEEWWQSLNEVIEIPLGVDGEVDMLALMEGLQRLLVEGGNGELHDLALEGSRIPVDVDGVKMLQVAMDARSWTAKAEKWIPSCEDSRRGKLEDIREHADKALELRDRLPISKAQRELWILQGEKELDDIVEAADTWYEKYAQFLEGDKRRTGGRQTLSITKLRRIVSEGTAIFANLGNPTVKISRILTQAESWYQDHLQILKICKLAPTEAGDDTTSTHSASAEDFSKAAEAAKAEVSLDLEEAASLRRLVERIEHWSEKVSLVAPKRTKRGGKAGRPKLAVDDLVGLIDEARELPIDTADDVQRLRIQLSNIQVWRSHATAELEKAISGFQQLRTHVDTIYGSPDDFSLDRFSNKSNVTITDGVDDDSSKASGCDSMNQLNGETSMAADNASSIGDSDAGDDMIPDDSNDDVNVFRTIKELQESSKDNGVTTVEGDLADTLHNVSQWCLRSFKYLNTPRDVFDKRYFGAFDRFVMDGESLVKDTEESIPPSNEVSIRVNNSWKKLVLDQLKRLGTLTKEREQFLQWCQSASQLIADEKKLTRERLDDLAARSRHFPANSDVVTKIRSLSSKVSKWSHKVQEQLKSGEKLDAQDVKALIESGEKLKCSTQELRTLKAELRSAKSWSNRVKKCNIGQSSMNLADVEQLIMEHDNLLIEMPDELDELKQATVGYCICRRPYEGFMIGCDHCDEWYHGPCIGITESRAERCEKFMCVRCSTKKCYEVSATGVARLIRKWTCQKDRKKARQVENQKVQRKFRKEKKDIEKFEVVIRDAQARLTATQTHETLVALVPTSTALDKAEGGEKNDNSCSAIQPHEEGFKSTTPENLPQSSQAPVGEPHILTNGKTESDKNTSLKQPCNGIGVEAESTNTTGSSGADNSVPVATLKSDVSTTSPSSADGHHLAQKTENGTPAEGQTSQDEHKAPSVLQINEEETRKLLEKTQTALEAANKRLADITQKLREVKVAEKKEDELSPMLRNFFLLVRSHVLVPSQATTADVAQPLFGVKLSPPMLALLSDAKALGIVDSPDVQSMMNYFMCMTWSLSAMAILQRKPHASEVAFLVDAAEKVNFPDEKAFRTMKFMHNRILQFFSKVKKLEAAKPGEKKSSNFQLQDLVNEMAELPLQIQDIQLQAGKTSQADDCINELSNGTPPFGSYLDVGRSVDIAPDPKTFWPPFGLLGSKAAIEALGEECSAIPDALPLQTSEISNKTEEVAVSSGLFPSAAPSLSDDRRGPSTDNMPLNQSITNNETLVIESRKTTENSILVSSSSEGTVGDGIMHDKRVDGDSQDSEGPTSTHVVPETLTVSCVDRVNNGVAPVPNSRPNENGNTQTQKDTLEGDNETLPSSGIASCTHSKENEETLPVEAGLVTPADTPSDSPDLIDSTKNLFEAGTKPSLTPVDEQDLQPAASPLLSVSQTVATSVASDIEVTVKESPANGFGVLSSTSATVTVKDASA